MTDIYGDIYWQGVGVGVYVDWDKDGDYADPGEDVTSDVRPLVDPLRVQYGREPGPDTSVVSGSGGFTLDNRFRRYSSRNTESVLYGLIKPNRPVVINRTVSDVTYTLFHGHTDSTPLNPSIESRTVGVSLVDHLADFRGQNISTPLYRGVRTGDAIGYVLDACGWPAALRDLDPGATVIPWWWEDGTDAMSALDGILQSEGHPALLSVAADGSIVYRDRHHRSTQTRSTTSQATFRGSGHLPPVMTGLTYDDAWQNVINTGTATAEVRTVAVQDAVWSSEAQITLSTGEQRTIIASATDPFLEAVVPVEGTDYTLLSGAATFALSRTSGASTVITITATAGPVIIADLRLRARPVVVAHSTSVGVSDVVSIGDYGARAYSAPLPWCNAYDAQAILDATIAQRAQPLPVLSVRFACGADDVATGILLGLQLSDRVTVVEFELSLDQDFYIESIQHEVTGLRDHTVIFGLEAASTPVNPLFRFDTAGQGFNDGRFGSGVDDPTRLFRFDGVSGQRFNEGVFAL